MPPTRPKVQRFQRLSASTVTMQVHARDDSRYALLPVMQPASIEKWVIYDVQSGEILDTNQFTNLIEAKEWLKENYPL